MIEKLIKKRINEIREWVPREKARVETSLAELKHELQDKTLQGLSRASVDIEFLAVFHSRNGIVQVLAGNDAGWRELHRGMMYQFWKLRIESQRFFKTAFLQPVFQRGLNLTGSLGYVANLLCYSIASGKQSMEQAVLEILLQTILTRGAVSDGYWEKRQFEPFALRLYALHANIDLPPAVMERELGPYQFVLEKWNDPAGLADALRGICDYHAKNMVDKGPQIPPFRDSPFDVVPMEIMAIRAIREKQGQAFPAFDHPLLAAGLANMQLGEWLFVDDSALDDVADIYRSIYGS